MTLVDDPVVAPALVETTAGVVRSTVVDGVHAFLGVPYGAPAVGEARFRTPAPVAGWAGVRDAVAYGAVCPPSYNAANRAALARSPLWHAYARTDLPESEDCLSANVWTPAPSAGERRPVVVWVHGGAFTWGCGASRLTEGDVLAREHGLVVASFNHRLGVLGFLGVDAADAAAGTVPGVAGLLDIGLLLRWVRDNVAAFGGDPGNVTVAGHSGGGAKIACLLAMPSVRGLFHRAMLLSGPGAAVAEGIDVAAARLERIVAEVAPGDGLARLREAPVDVLTDEAARNAFVPTVDGDVLAAHPMSPEAARVQPEVPIVIGTTRDDTSSFKPFEADPSFERIGDDALVEIARTNPLAMLGERAEAVIERFRRRHSADRPADLAIRITTATMRSIVEQLAAARAEAGGTVHLFRFDVDLVMPPGTSLPGRRLAPHGAEIPWLFGVQDRIGVVAGMAAGPGTAGLRTALVELARSGVPHGPDDAPWPVYDTTTRQQRLFGVEVVDVSTRDDPDLVDLAAG